MSSNRGKGRGDARGFAGMDPDRQRMIASRGGETVSQNREHMAMIGRRGGETVSQDREHMAEIGREGGHHSHSNSHSPTHSVREHEDEPREPEAQGGESGL